MSPIQRQQPRYPLLLCVDRGQGWTGWTENVSEAGVFVLSDDAPAAGTECRLRLGLPGALEPFDIAGTVAWVRPASTWQPAGYGVALTGADSAMCRVAQACASTESPTRTVDVLLIRAAYGAGQVSGGITLDHRDDSESAVSYVREHAGAVVISSVFPPVTDCLATVKDVLSAGASAVFCIASGHADDDARALAAGSDALLPRPLSVGLLLTSFGCLLRL